MTGCYQSHFYYFILLQVYDTRQQPIIEIYEQTSLSGGSCKTRIPSGLPRIAADCPGFPPDCHGLPRIPSGLPRIAPDCPGLPRIASDSLRIASDCLGLSPDCLGLSPDCLGLSPDCLGLPPDFPGLPRS